ncbi:MAG: pseudouridine synthase [Candidatus Kerfeldbacteria bacterium]
MRINRYIAHCGVASRRKADDLIAAGRVTVNGSTVRDFSVDVKDSDVVEVDGTAVSLPGKTTTVAWYKPVGVTTTLSDPHAVATLHDALPKQYQGLKPAGRLDRLSEGLLILTDDGSLIQELTHPSFEHEKEYYVELQDVIHDEKLKQLAKGISLQEGNTGKAEVERLGRKKFRIVLKQGWKRQIRRMVEAVGNSVTMLKRVRIGKVKIGTMKPGEIIEITRQDIL